MLRLRIRNRRAFIIAVVAVFVLFGAALGALYYTSNQALAKQQSEQNDRLAAYDKQIAKAKKVAEEKKAAAKKEAERIEAERKAAEQKAAADAALAAQLRGQIVTPKGCAISGAHGDPHAIDVVINKKRCFNPVDFVPSDLTSFGGFVVSAKIVPHLSAMFNAAAAAGAPLSLTSSYRSYANQVSTYNNWVAVNGSTASADTVSARPGYSEHQTGYAVDLSAGGCSLECFRGSAQYQWMIANAATFGFVERYPQGHESVTGYSPEAWHWRYVGSATAQDMKAKNIKTLEQYWSIPGGSY